MLGETLRFVGLQSTPQASTITPFLLHLSRFNFISEKVAYFGLCLVDLCLVKPFSYGREGTPGGAGKHFEWLARQAAVCWGGKN